MSGISNEVGYDNNIILFLKKEITARFRSMVSVYPDYPTTQEIILLLYPMYKCVRKQVNSLFPRHFLNPMGRHRQDRHDWRERSGARPTALVSRGTGLEYRRTS